MKTKKIVEKKTGEKYTSKMAMAKHEKGESKSMKKKELKNMAFNIKEASNQNLTAGARNNYAKNAQADMKNSKKK